MRTRHRPPTPPTTSVPTTPSVPTYPLIQHNTLHTTSTHYIPTSTHYIPHPICVPPYLCLWPLEWPSGFTSLSQTRHGNHAPGTSSPSGHLSPGDVAPPECGVGRSSKWPSYSITHVSSSSVLVQSCSGGAVLVAAPSGAARLEEKRAQLPHELCSGNPTHQRFTTVLRKNRYLNAHGTPTSGSGSLLPTEESVQR